MILFYFTKNQSDLNLIVTTHRRWVMDLLDRCKGPQVTPPDVVTCQHPGMVPGQETRITVKQSVGQGKPSSCVVKIKGQNQESMHENTL